MARKCAHGKELRIIAILGVPGAEKKKISPENKKGEEGKIRCVPRMERRMERKRKRLNLQGEKVKEKKDFGEGSRRNGMFAKAYQESKLEKDHETSARKEKSLDKQKTIEKEKKA